MPGRPAYIAYKWLWATLDLLFPATCGGCDKGQTRWCLDCQSKVEIISPPICEICGGETHTQGLCINCRLKPPLCEAIRSWAIFSGPVRNATHKFKYKRDISLGIILARPIISIFASVGWDIDLIVPVPLGVARMRERGYNQSALLARPLALNAGIKYQPQALTRVRETTTQVGLSLNQRRDNVKNAFRSMNKEVEGKSILVVDDVMTSGATLESCATALLKVGAAEVFAVTLARAGKIR